jgi:hypothetical protein
MPIGGTAELLDISDAVLASASESGGVALIDCLILAMGSLAKLRVKSASGVIQATYTAGENGVGDGFIVEPGETYAFSFAAPSLVDPSTPEVRTDDGIWSGNDPHAIYHEGKTYLTASTSDGRIVVVSVEHGTGLAQRCYIKSGMIVNNHVSPVIRVKADGRLQVFVNNHAGPTLFHYTSTNPGDITHWQAEQTIAGTSSFAFAYPELIELSDRVRLHWRWQSSATNYRRLYADSFDDGATWGAEVNYLQNNPQRPYVRAAKHPSSDRIDWVTNTGNPSEVVASIYHFFQIGEQYFRSDGTLIGDLSDLPLAISDLTLVFDAAGVDNALAYGICHDPDGVPIILFFTTPDPENHSAHQARYIDGAWRVVKIADVGGTMLPDVPGQAHVSAGGALDATDTRRVWIAIEQEGIASLHEYLTLDEGLNWTGIERTPGDVVSNFIPFVPRNRHDDLAVLWARGEWDDFGVFATDVMSLQATPPPPPPSVISTPCALVLEVYEDDGETIAWEVSTEPAHENPFLCLPQHYGEATIDVVNGAATIAQIEVVVIDRRQIAGDQDTGFVTERVQDIRGKRCRLRRFISQEEGFVTIIDGPAAAPRMDGYAAFKWVIRDTRETERKKKAFAVTGSTALFPMGVVDGFGYNAVTDTYLRDPVLPAVGEARDGLFEIPESTTFPQVVMRFLDTFPENTDEQRTITAKALEALEGQLEILSTEDGPFSFTIHNWRCRFPNLTVRWRARGSVGDWNIIPAGSVAIWGQAWVNGAGGLELGRFMTNPLESSGGDGLIDRISFGDERATNFVTAPVLPAHGQEVEAVLIWSGPPTETSPYHLEGLTLGELCERAYQGVYSLREPVTGALVPTGIRHDPAALALLTDPVLARLDEPVEDIRDMLEKLGYGPAGWVPALDLDARISPVSQIPPDEIGGLIVVSNPITEPTDDWNAGQRVVNKLSFTYPRFFVPTDPSVEVGGDGIAVRMITHEFVDPASIAKEGEFSVSYDGSLFGALGDGIGEAAGVEHGAILANARRLYVFDRYRNGAQAIRVPVHRRTTASLRAGSWVPVDLSWFPDYTTRRRGMVTGGQIIAIADLDCSSRELLIEEAFPVVLPPES